MMPTKTISNTDTDSLPETGDEEYPVTGRQAKNIVFCTLPRELRDLISKYAFAGTRIAVERNEDESHARRPGKPLKGRVPIYCKTVETSHHTTLPRIQRVATRPQNSLTFSRQYSREAVETSYHHTTEPRKQVVATHPLDSLLVSKQYYHEAIEAFCHNTTFTSRFQTQMVRCLLYWDPTMLLHLRHMEVDLKLLHAETTNRLAALTRHCPNLRSLRLRILTWTAFGERKDTSFLSTGCRYGMVDPDSTLFDGLLRLRALMKVSLDVENCSVCRRTPELCSGSTFARAMERRLMDRIARNRVEAAK